MQQHYRALVLAMALAVAAGGYAASSLQGQVIQGVMVTPVLGDAAQVYRVQKAVVRPEIDGIGDEWMQVPAMTLGTAEQARGVWRGPQDLSGALRLQWDDRGLYFYLEVVDDVHSAPNEKDNWWENDCCQFAFDPYLNGPNGGYDQDEHGYLIGDSPKGPIFAAYRMPGFTSDREQLLQGRTVKMRTRADGTRCFEWMMTWQQLAPLSPALFGRCGFTFSLNDNDGQGFKGALSWTKGLIYGQDASQFGQLVFEGAQDAQNARPLMLGLRPEVKLAPDAQSYWLPIAGADPWHAARLLVKLPQEDTVSAKVTVYRAGEKKAVASGTLSSAVAADTPAVFTWDLAALPDGAYDIEYAVSKPKLGPPQRMTFHQVHLDALRARKDALRKQYGLDRPWDPMREASALIRRHRGMVAMTLGLLEDDVWNTAMANVNARQEHLQRLANGAAMIAALDEGKDFLARQRGVFWSAYCSVADGSGQSFVVSLPANFDPQRTYPLVVHLHGAGGVPGLGDVGQTNTQSHILVMPWGRGGFSWYRGLGENDVLAVIAYMKSWYRIDDDRVYVTGASMGGAGAWRLASRYPDLFAAAAPICGDATQGTLENLRNVPVLNQHGALDWTVPVDLSRIAVRALQQWGYPALYQEIPDAGHSISGLYPATDWMLAQRRSRQLQAVTYTTHQADTGAYWATIRRLTDPHRKATLHAQVIGYGAQQALLLRTDNIDVLELDLKQMPLHRRHALLLQMDGQFLPYAGPLPDRLFLVRGSKSWTPFRDWQAPVTPTRPYRAGAAAQLYTGEPLMIIYGTQGDTERRAKLRTIADSLSRFNGSALYDEDMPAGRFPMKADREVTAEDMSRYNLIVIGGAQDNVLAAMIQSRLPFTINEKQELLAGGRRPLQMEGGSLSCTYYNPLAPQRLLHLIVFDANNDLQHALANPRTLMGDVWRDAVGDIPDLFAASPAGERKLQFTDGWQWLVLPGSDRKAPAAYFDYAQQLAMRLPVMRQTSGADFALDVIRKAPDTAPSPDVPAQDVTMADLATQHSAQGTVLAGMTGEELLGLAQTAADQFTWLIYPALDPQTIDRGKLYRVILPARQVWSFASIRQQNLHQPEAGPDIPWSAIWQAAQPAP